MKIALEIRPGEGGEDARLLVKDQAAIYLKYAAKHGLVVYIEDDAKS